MRVIQIVKEYQEDVVEMRGPSNPKAAPVKTGGITSFLRTEPAEIDALSLTKLFNIASRDFPNLPKDQIQVDRVAKRLVIAAEPPAGAGYVPLKPRVIAARG